MEMSKPQQPSEFRLGIPAPLRALPLRTEYVGPKSARGSKPEQCASPGTPCHSNQISVRLVVFHLHLHLHLRLRLGLSTDSAGGSKPEQCASRGKPCHSNQISVRLVVFHLHLHLHLRLRLGLSTDSAGGSKPEQCASRGKPCHSNQISVRLVVFVFIFIFVFVFRPVRRPPHTASQRDGNSRVRLSWWVEARTVCFARDSSPFQSNHCPSLSSPSSSYHYSPPSTPILFNGQPGFKSIWTEGQRERRGEGERGKRWGQVGTGG